jgi:membrane protease YdiL (CAAX protease family)
MLMPLPLVIVANSAVGKPWAVHATGILPGMTAGIAFLFGLSLATGVVQTVPGGQPLAVGVGVMATAVVAATLASKPVRERVARVMPIDPDSPVHAYALVLAVILFGSNLATTVFVNVLVVNLSRPPLDVGDIAASEIPYVILAVFGVGLYIRRNTAGAAQRLGLMKPTWWQLAIALASAGAFFAFIQGANLLSHAWTPEIAGQVDRANAHEFGGLVDPISIAAVTLLPGICEEVLFRGALQPRFGLVATAILFAVVHTQYALSLVELSVLVVAIGLGLIRKYTNTTTSCVCHVSYNLLAAIGIAGGLIGAAAGVELALLAVSGYAVWQIRRRHVAPVQR